jgi:hypothetical protein
MLGALTNFMKFLSVYVVIEGAVAYYIIYTSAAIGRQLEAFMAVVNE